MHAMIRRSLFFVKTSALKYRAGGYEGAAGSAGIGKHIAHVLALPLSACNIVGLQCPELMACRGVADAE